MYLAHTVPGRYTLKPLSLVLYLEEEKYVWQLIIPSKMDYLYSACTTNRNFFKWLKVLNCFAGMRWFYTFN
jgi:hypothetical protein